MQGSITHRMALLATASKFLNFIHLSHGDIEDFELATWKPTTKRRLTYISNPRGFVVRGCTAPSPRSHNLTQNAVII